MIVEVTGDAANGFGIIYANGDSSYPPTGSEGGAECSEHDTSAPTCGVTRIATPQVG